MSPALYGEDTLVPQTTGGPGPVPAPTGGGELHLHAAQPGWSMRSSPRLQLPAAGHRRRLRVGGRRANTTASGVGARSSGTKWQDPEDLAEESWCVWDSAARGGDLLRMLDFVAAVWPWRLTPEIGKPSGLPTHGVTHGGGVRIYAQSIHSHACEPRLTWIPTCIEQPS